MRPPRVFTDAYDSSIPNPSRSPPAGGLGPAGSVHTMMFATIRRTAPWQGNRAMDMHHALLVEEALANVRAVVIVVSLAVATLETWRTGWPTAAAILLAMTAYSVAVAVALRRHRIHAPNHVTVLHVVDSVGILAAMLVTGGALSPFSTLFLFVLLAAGYRWGGPETWLTAAVGITVLGAHGVTLWVAGVQSAPDLHLVALRVSYAAMGGLLIGYMAEAQRIERYSALSVSRILGRVRVEAGLVAAVQAVLDELVSQFGATHALLLLEEEGNDRVSLWQAERRPQDSRRAIVRLKQEPRRNCATYLFPVPAGVDAFEVRRPSPGERPGRTGVVALDATGARIHEAVGVRPLLDAPFPWRTAFCVSTIAGEGWKGRVFLFLPHDPLAAREQLGYLRGIVRQVGPALFNLYLQRRLQSRAGVVERARISRELHDGVIQALIGIEMQLEVMRREAAGKVPETLSRQLTNVQRLLSQEVLNVRDLMQLLRPAEVDPKHLAEHLADMVERFRHRTGIQARLTCDADDIDLTPRVCREMAGMVQEALANVRKHSGATSVVVRLGQCGPHWQLVIDDNGRGLDFEGYLTPEEADAQRKGPQTIKERARSIGGRLALHSQPGFGTRLEITIPRKHHG
jgi:signal transduction histidine kinase